MKIARHCFLASLCLLLGYWLLAERNSPASLPMKRTLLVQCDDAGAHTDFNRGTIAALEGGIVKSASIIVPGPAFQEIAAFARAHPEYSWGVHLTLTSEFKTHRWSPVLGDSVPSLKRSDGTFWQTEEEVLQEAKLDEIERELRAQIEQARAAGVSLSYLDSHMSVLYMREDLAWLLYRLSQDFQLPMLFARRSPETNASADALAASYEPLIEKLQAGGNPIFDSINLANYTVRAAQKKEYFQNYIRTLPPGFSLLTLHCALSSAELSRITGTAARRNADVEAFRDAEVFQTLRAEKVAFLGWRELANDRRSDPSKPRIPVMNR